MPPFQRFHNARRTLERRRSLRSATTLVEAILWRSLRKSALHGRKFRRQQGIGPYIVDFYCPDEKLVVELEGAAHDGDDNAARDEVREAYIERAGMTMLRIENRHVVENLDGVLAYIARHFARR